MNKNSTQKNILKKWQIIKLKSLGKTYSGIIGKTKDDFGTGSPYISYMNIYSNSKIDTKNIDTFVKLEENEKQNKIKFGDLFFTTSSETPDEVGISSVLLDKNIKDIYLNSFCFGFRLDNFEILTPEFSQYYFRGYYFRKAMTRIAQGASRFNLSKKYFLDTKITIPESKNEQNRIVSVLETWDKYIENLNKKIEVKKQIKKGLMQDLLTGKKRLSGFKDEWEIKKLKKICNFIVDNRGKTPQVEDKGIPLIEVNAIGQKNINYLKISKFVSEDVYKSWFRNYLEDGDILFSTVGRTAMTSLYRKDIQAVIAQNIVGLRFHQHDFTFMYYLLTEDSNNFKFKRIEMIAVQPSVKVSQMINLKFKIPEIKEQKAIANILTTADKEISELENKLGIIKDQKKYLLNNLITGTIRTKEGMKIIN